MMPRAPEFREWLLAQIEADADVDIASRAAAHFGVTRQAVARHLGKLLDSREIVAKGNTRARRYTLAKLTEFSQSYELGAAFQEDLVWSQALLPLIRALPANILDICAYGVTEMLNNAKDHSGAESVLVALELTALQLSISVYDRGVGIFRKIKEAHDLEDERHAILELTKGKLTTDPEHHTGEGVFFTSRAFDGFGILSGSLSLTHKREGSDWLMDDANAILGTHVTMEIRTDSRHSVQEVFDLYATARDDYAFQKTHLLVGLAQTDGTSLVSRSQAKRIMARCERFREVALDFRGIGTIGPAFADEIFRVWRGIHPNVKLLPTGMTEEVGRMIRRAQAAAEESSPSET